MPGRRYFNRISAIGMGLLACTLAWLAAYGDGPSPAGSNPAGKAPRSAVSPATEKPPQAEPETVPPTLSTSEEAIVNEILQIRREQGGLLDGTLLEELSGAPPRLPGQAPSAQDDEFVRALRGVAAGSSAQPVQTQPNLPVGPSISIEPPLEPTGTRPGSSSGDEDEDLITLLRLAARRLDHQSADFEDVEAYRRANRCRSVAHQLRRLARDLKAHSTRAIHAPRPERPTTPVERP